MPVRTYRQLRSFFLKQSGAEGTRTPDFLLAKEALSRLSYSPMQEKYGTYIIATSAGYFNLPAIIVGQLKLNTNWIGRTRAS